MAEFPITLLLEEVGTVSWGQEGLYYCYHAKISCPMERFYRLYLHQGDKHVSLGVFSPMGELCGKIAANKICENKPVFTLTESIWYPKHSDITGRCSVAATTRNEEETLFVSRFKPLPREVMPYVCFLCPASIENLPGLTVTLDKQGRPVVHERD